MILSPLLPFLGQPSDSDAAAAHQNLFDPCKSHFYCLKIRRRCIIFK